MTYRTQWIPALRAAYSPTHFLLNSLLFHASYLLVRLFRRRDRNVGTVQRNYDSERAKLLARLDAVDWHDYVLFPRDQEDFILIDDRVRWGTLLEAREAVLARLAAMVRERVKPGQIVVEFGSGDGRNILYLRKLFPDIRFVGLELSPVSVELSAQAARKFGLDGVSFKQADVCAPLPAGTVHGDVGLVYSSFALEQMPRIFRGALANMLVLDPAAVYLMEPVPEVWARNLRGVVSRLRVRAIDRLRSLPEVLAEVLHEHPGFTLVRNGRSGIAINPHTEMCEVVLERSRRALAQAA